MIEKWEYRLMPLAPERDPMQIQEALNATGDEGWELVAVYISTAGFNTFVFKRPTRK
jgi:hypothetical protein